MLGNSLTNIRFSLQDIDPGQFLDIHLSPVTQQQFTVWFDKYSKLAPRSYRWELRKDGFVRVWCLFAEPGAGKYGLEKLAVGETTYIEIPAKWFGRLRSAASRMRRQSGMNFQLRADDEGMHVTRLKDDEIVDGKLVKVEREHQGRYDIRTLDVGQNIFVPIEWESGPNLRSYVSYYSKTHHRRFRVSMERGKDFAITGHRIIRIA